jgi:hypothetical protein
MLSQTPSETHYISEIGMCILFECLPDHNGLLFFIGFLTEILSQVQTYADSQTGACIHHESLLHGFLSF